MENQIIKEHRIREIKNMIELKDQRLKYFRTEINNIIADIMQLETQLYELEGIQYKDIDVDMDSILEENIHRKLK